MSTPPLHHPVPQHRINFDGVETAQKAKATHGAQPTHSAQPTPGFQQYPHYPQYPPSMPSMPNMQGGAQYVPGMSTAPNAHYVPSATPQAYPGFNPLQFVNNDLGKHALNYGQQYIQQSIGQYNANSLKYYFQVTNEYVRNKLLIIMFPWRHKPWSRQLKPVQDTNGVEMYCFPSEDTNAPDMYIPIMAFITHLVLIALHEGMAGNFHPEQFGARTSKAFALIAVELILLKVFTYLLAASGSSLLDLCAYSGYKFVGLSVTSLVMIVSHNVVLKWCVFAYTGCATAFFMLRSLKYILLPEYASSIGNSTATSVNGNKHQQRIQFLFFYGVICQLVLMWLLL